MTLPIYLDPSFSDALTMYGGDTVPYEALVWQRFVALANIDPSQPLTDDQKANFRAFLQRYQAWDLGVSALTSSIVERSDYQKYYDLATNIFSQMQISPSVVELRDMWRAFLLSKGYTTPPPTSVDFSDAFSAYIQDLAKKAISYDWSKPVVDPDAVPQIQLWNRFLEISNVSPTDTPSADLKATFAKFLQRYNIWGVTGAVLQSTNTLPTTSDSTSEFFSNYLNAFYGDLSSTEKNDLWNTFLQSQGLTSNPSNLAPLQEKFVSFINGIRSKEQQLEGATSLSPNEIKTRMVLSTTMTNLKSMLLRSQDVVSTYSAALMIYGNWQKEYTTMMNRVPSISPIADSSLATDAGTTLRIPTDADPTKWNLSDFTFGYAKISLSDVTNWAVANLMDPKLPLGDTVVFEIATDPDQGNVGRYSFQLTTDSSGKKSITVSYVNTQSQPPIPSTSSGPISLVDSTGKTLDFTTAETKVETAYKQLFSTLFTNYTGLQTYLNGTSSIGYIPAMQGRYLDTTPKTYTDSKGNPVTDSTVIQKRTEQNAVLQQYIEGIRTNRSSLQTQMQQMQSVLTGSRDAIDAISDLWTSIIETMDVIVQSIFKHSHKT